MPVASALVPPRVAHPPVIVHGHAALVTAVAAITIGARVGRPTHDLAQVGNEAAAPAWAPRHRWRTAR